jgi:DNA primase
VDKDAAGVVAGITLRDTLLKHGKDVVLLPLEKDLNDLYVEAGAEAVREVIRAAMGMFRRL